MIGVQKKGIQWSIVGVVMFVLFGFAIFVADRVFNFQIIDIKWYFFLIAMGISFFVLTQFIKSLHAGTARSFESWFTIILVIAGVVAFYHYFPNMAPQFSAAMQPIFSAMGLP